MNKKECLQCGDNKKLYKINNNKYACINCLNKLANEQNKIKEHLQEYLLKEYNIKNPYTQCKTLQSIIYIILLENNLLDEHTKNKIIKIAKEMEKIEQDSNCI